MNTTTDLATWQKIFLIVWFLAFIIAFINGIMELYPVIDEGFNSVSFNDGLKRVVINCFYIYISFVLFRILYYQKGKFINLVSVEGQKQISKLSRALIGLLATKIVFNFIINHYVLPKAVDSEIANNLGYALRSGTKIQQHSDLLIAFAIIWVFQLVLNQAQKIKQKQDLTI